MKEKKSLNVVYDKDLETLLKNIGIFDDICEKKKKCKFCKTEITIENLHSLFPESDDIKIVCDNPTCIKKLSEYLNDKKL